MDPQAKIPLEDLNQIQLRDLVDGIAEEYRDVLKIRLKNKGLAGVVEEIGVRQRSSAGFFDVDTGAIAVVEHRTGGKTTRQVIKLNNGFRSEKAAPIARNFGEPHRLVQQGPFRGSINGEKVTYIKHGDVRIEYKGQQVTRIVGPDEIEIPRAKFGDVKIFPNEHHAEMRILQWAERNNYRIVALAPTRGCCPHCALAMQQYFIKQNVNIDDAIPKARQNRSLWRSFLKELKAAPKSAPVEYTVKGGQLDVAALRAKFKTQVTAFKAPDPRIVRISRFLKVAGPAMVAFDAATSYARAADQWDKGNRDAAAETLAEFGGRAAGAFVGAEACGLAFAGCGSVIPGLGTTVGGLAGIVIGGAVGAYLGEQGARQLCDQIIAWTKGEQLSAPPSPLPVASKPQSTNPEVAKLQSEMQAAGYSAPEIAGIGRLFESPELQGKSPAAAFQRIGNDLVPHGATDEGDTWLAQYPAPGEPDQKVSSAQSIPPQPIVWPIPTPNVDPRPQVQPPSHLGPAPLHDDTQTPHVVATVHAELIKPQSNTTAPNEPATEPISQVPRDVESVSTTDLAERVDQLRSRLQEYDALAAGQTALVSRDQFAADSNELRNIQDQLTLSGASPMELHALQVKLNEVRNRYDQVESNANWADDRKAEILQKQQDEERWRADQAAREGRRAEEMANAANAQQRNDHDLREIEESECKDRERDRREDQERADKRQRQEQEADDRRRRGEEDREAGWKAEDDRKREAERLRNEEYRKADEIRSQQKVEARVRAAMLTEEEQARDAERRQQSEEHAQQLIDDDRRRAEEAGQRENQRLQDDKEAQRRIDAAREQALDDAQRRVDEQLRQDAIRAQQEADEKLRVAGEEQRREDERHQQEVVRQSADQSRRDALDTSTAQPIARTEPDDRRELEDQRAVDNRREVEARRDAEDTRQRADEDQRRADQHAADEAAQAERARQLDLQTRDSSRPTDRNIQSHDSNSPQGQDRQPVSARDAEDRQLAVELQVEARRVDEALRLQAERQQRIDEENRRQQELEQQRAVEEQRRLAEEELRRQLELEQQFRLQEAWRLQQEEQQRQVIEESRRQQEEAQQRLEAAWRQQQEEQERQAEEEERRRRQQQEEEQRQMQEIWRQQQEEQQRRADEEYRRQQEEEQRRRVDEWRRQQEEQQRWQQDEADRRQRQEEEDRKNVSGKILWPGQDPYP